MIVTRRCSFSYAKYWSKSVPWSGVFGCWSNSWSRGKSDSEFWSDSGSWYSSWVDYWSMRSKFWKKNI